MTQVATFDPLAIAGDLVPAPAANEIVVVRCNYPQGCENLAMRSDGRCSRHSKFALMTPAIEAESRERLKRMTPEMIDLIPEAARNAAANGDIKPMAWVLTHSKIVEPVAPEPRGALGGNQLIVQVGIVLPGLPGSEE